MELRKRRKLNYGNHVPVHKLGNKTEKKIHIKQEKKEVEYTSIETEGIEHLEKETRKVANVQRKGATKKTIDVSKKPKVSKSKNTQQGELESLEVSESRNTEKHTSTVVKIKKMKTSKIPNSNLCPTATETATSSDSLIPNSTISSTKDSLLIDKNILPDTTKNLKHIINNISLKRPTLKTVDLPQDNENIETVPIQCLEKYKKDLNRLIKLQQELYYKNLKTPRLLGPKHFRHLKFPDDMINLQKISYSLEELVHYRKMMEKRNVAGNNDYIDDTLQYSSTHLSTENRQKLISIAKHKDNDKLNDEDATALIANIHGIDSSIVRDIKCNNLYIDGKINFDPDYINISELKSICKKIDKPLLRERCNNLSWPSRMKKKKHKPKNGDINEENNANPVLDINEKHPSYKFHNIPLFNSI